MARTIKELLHLFQTSPGSLTPSELRFVRAEKRRLEKQAKPGGYEAHKASARKRQRELANADRDISAEYPGIANVERRLSCRDSLEAFGRTYNPGTFRLDCSPDHRDLIACLEDAILHSASHSRAMPRGGGKSSWSQAAILWGVSYYPERFNRYCFLIGANEGKATENLDDVKEWLELPDYAADFPEIAYPFLRLERDARKTLLFKGEPIRMGYKQDRLIFPVLPPPPNWPADWPLRPDGTVPSSGTIFVCCGLTSKSIRGSKKMQGGETLRPGLVLLDDVQDDEVAVSPTQIERYKRIITRAVMGMAGPDKRIAIVAPCTCIAPGDVAEWLLDRQANPIFRGKKSGILKSMPTNLAAWDNYAEVFRADLLKEDFTASNAYYLENRDKLDEGAAAAWEESIKPPAVTAIQAAMNDYIIDPAGFWAEKMNEPLKIFNPDEDVAQLVAGPIMERLNRHRRGLVPAWATHLTCGIDVGERLLHYTVAAWGEGFRGAVVDYGVMPEQKRLYYRAREASPTLTDFVGIPKPEVAIYEGLKRLTETLVARTWERDGGGACKIDKLLVDSGDATDTIYRFCRECANPGIVMASKGKGITARKNPISDWPTPKPGEKRGLNWVSLPPNQSRPIRLFLLDTNFWKSQAAAGLLVPQGDAAALTLFGDRAEQHRLYADHLASEKRLRIKNMDSGREVDEWELRIAGADNHFWDTLVLAAGAASLLGVTSEKNKPAQPKRASAAEAAAKRAAFESGQRRTNAAASAKRAEFEARRHYG